MINISFYSSCFILREEPQYIPTLKSLSKNRQENKNNNYSVFFVLFNIKKINKRSF